MKIELLANTDFLANLEMVLPDPILRKEVGELTHGLVSPRTLANCDIKEKNTGPKERRVVNGKIAYSRKSFIEWLLARTRLCNKTERKRSKADEFLDANAEVKAKNGGRHE